MDRVQVPDTDAAILVDALEKGRLFFPELASNFTKPVRNSGSEKRFKKSGARQAIAAEP